MCPLGLVKLENLFALAIPTTLFVLHITREIGVEISATVKEVLFREGDKVRVGEVLLKLDEKKLKLKLEFAPGGHYHRHHLRRVVSGRL